MWCPTEAWNSFLHMLQDEVDALAGQRSAGDDAASRRLLTELLLQMTAAAAQEAIYVFACTNRIQVSIRSLRCRSNLAYHGAF